MGSIDYGSQTLSFDFKERGRSEDFNRINYKLFQDGIYEGANLTRVSDTEVSISSGTYYITDPATGIGVRVTTSTAYTITVSTTNVYLVARMIWINVENNYMDLLAIPYANIQAGDLILGRCIFNGSELYSNFDLTRRSIVDKNILNNLTKGLKVTAKEPISTDISVSAGSYVLNGNHIEFSGGDITVSNCSLGRKDLVCLDVSGNLSIVEGIDSGSPTYPNFPDNKIVIAKISRIGSRTNINGSEIVDVGSHLKNYYVDNRTPKGYIDNLLIESSNTTLTVKSGLVVRVANTMYEYESDIIITPNLTADGYKWGALVINESTGQVSSIALSSITTSGYTTGLNEANNSLNMFYLYNNNYGYCRAEVSGTFYRIIAVFKQMKEFTDATVDSTNNSSILTCDSTLKLTEGMKISRTGIPAGSYILEVRSATQFLISQAATTTSSNVTATFGTGGQIHNITPIYNLPKTSIKLSYYSTYNIVGTIPLISSFDINSEFNSTSKAVVPKIQKKLNFDFSAKVSFDAENGNDYFDLALTNNNIVNGSENRFRCSAYAAASSRAGWENTAIYNNSIFVNTNDSFIYKLIALYTAYANDSIGSFKIEIKEV